MCTDRSVPRFPNRLLLKKIKKQKNNNKKNSLNTNRIVSFFLFVICQLGIVTYTVPLTCRLLCTDGPLVLFFKYIFGRPINWAHNQCAVELDSNYFPFRFYFPVPCLYNWHISHRFDVFGRVARL